MKFLGGRRGKQYVEICEGNGVVPLRKEIKQDG